MSFLSCGDAFTQSYSSNMCQLCLHLTGSLAEGLGTDVYLPVTSPYFRILCYSCCENTEWLRDDTSKCLPFLPAGNLGFKAHTLIRSTVNFESVGGFRTNTANP